MERKETMLIRQLIEFITPVSCLSCGQEGDQLCAECLATTPRRASVCYRCNRLTAGFKTCSNCRRHSSLSGVVVGAHYGGVIKDLILKLKFERSASVARVLSELIAASIATPSGFDLVTAVPVSPRRRRERGYNQAELIARGLAERLGLPYRPLLLRSSTDHQMGSSRADRFAQVRGAFSPLSRLAGERILLVDDVLTTGATAEEAASVLRSAGAARVYGAVVARHRT